METISASIYNNLPMTDLDGYIGALDTKNHRRLFPFLFLDSASGFSLEYGDGTVAKSSNGEYLAVIPLT